MDMGNSEVSGRAPIRLRAAEPEDAEFIFEMENKGFEEGWTDRAAPVSLCSIQTYLNTCDPDPYACGQLRLVCTDSEGGRIGLLDFYDISPIHRHAKIGIMIAEERRRAGYGTRLLRCASAYASRRLGLLSLAALIAAENRASIGIFEKCGYSKRGTLCNWWHCGQRLTDCLIYQIILQ